jgi:class 3 adenylate cyclase
MAAILVADVVGYSGLMEADEDGTARRLAACRNLIDTEIAKCDGPLFKAMGDAVLVEFASPINACGAPRVSAPGWRWRSRATSAPCACALACTSPTCWCKTTT